MVYCRRYVSIIEDRISSYLYNELFCKINDKKWRAFKNMACSLIVYKNTIRNCSTALQAFLFRSISLYPFFSFFIKARILLQFLSQAFSIFLMFSPIFFRFHKCFSNFHLSKNILINKFFFTEACVSSGICISQPPVFCLTSGPGPQFVFTSPGPRFLYTGPGL